MSIDDLEIINELKKSNDVQLNLLRQKIILRYILTVEFFWYKQVWSELKIYWSLLSKGFNLKLSK